MDRPLTIIVADSLKSLQRFGSRTVRADYVLIANATRVDRPYWGYAVLYQGEHGSATFKGVGLVWGSGEELTERLRENTMPQVLAIATSPLSPSERKTVEGRAMFLPIGKGVYCVELGRRPNGDVVQRLMWSEETVKPKRWKKPKPAPEPELESEPATEAATAPPESAPED